MTIKSIQESYNKVLEDCHRISVLMKKVRESQNKVINNLERQVEVSRKVKEAQNNLTNTLNTINTGAIIGPTKNEEE